VITAERHKFAYIIILL